MNFLPQHPVGTPRPESARADRPMVISKAQSRIFPSGEQPRPGRGSPLPEPEGFKPEHPVGMTRPESARAGRPMVTSGFQPRISPSGEQRSLLAPTEFRIFQPDRIFCRFWRSNPYAPGSLPAPPELGPLHTLGRGISGIFYYDLLPKDGDEPALPGWGGTKDFGGRPSLSHDLPLALRINGSHAGSHACVGFSRWTNLHS